MDIQQAKYQGVSTGQNRRKLLSDYNKVVKEVDNGLDLGFLTQAKYDEFKEISLTLGSGSKTNKYAKKLKKVEKEYNSVKYKKKANKKIKLDSKISKEELKKLALSKSTQIQLQRDLGFKGARQQASVNKTIFENRVRQLIRAGATRDEAEAIAKEEETQRKEQTTLEQQINLERIRQARGSTILPKGKLSTIANFTKNYAKTKGISFKDAQQQVKVQNLYRKYELQHLRGTAPTIPSTISISSSRVGTSSNIPTNILGRSKFLKKDGDLKKMFQDKLDKYLSKYGKDNSVKKSNKPKELFKILKTQKQTAQAIKDLEELTILPTIPAITRDRMRQLKNQVEDYNANYLDSFLQIKLGKLPLRQLPSGTLNSKSLPKTPSRSPSLPPTPTSSKKIPPPPPPRYKEIETGSTNERGSLTKKKDLGKAITFARKKQITQFEYKGKLYRQKRGTGDTKFVEVPTIPPSRFGSNTSQITKQGSRGSISPSPSPTPTSASKFQSLGSRTYPQYQEIQPDENVNQILALAFEEIYDNTSLDPQERMNELNHIRSQGVFFLKDQLGRIDTKFILTGDDADYIGALIHEIKQDNQVASGRGFSFSEKDLEGGGLYDTLKKAFGKGDEGLGKVAEGIQDLKGNKARREKEIDEEDTIPLKMSDNVYNTGNDRLDNIGGFILNRNASNEEHAVYINEAENKGIMVYRGSANLKDAYTDGSLAIGKFKGTQRFKDEVIWTRDILKLLPNLKWSVSGHSLGGTIANEISNIFKIPAVSFNAGYGINMKQSNDMVKSYHARGDPASALGVGRMGESIIVDNNTKGGIASHSLDNFKTEKYYSKYENMKNLQNDMRTNELQNSDVVDPSLEVNRFPNEPNYVSINQQQVAQEMGNQDAVGGAFENLIDAQHKDLQKNIRGFKMEFSKPKIMTMVDNVNHLSGYKAIHNDFSKKFNMIHKQLSEVNSHIGRINDPNLKASVNQAVIDTKYHLKNLKEENHAHIQKCIANKFLRGLNNNNQTLNSQVILGKDHLGERLGEELKKKSQVGSFLKGATQPITNPDKEAVYRQYFPNANSKILGKGLTLGGEGRGTYNLGNDKKGLLLTKLMNNASPKLIANLKAGALTTRDHKEIKKHTGMPINMLFKGGNIFSSFHDAVMKPTMEKEANKKHKLEFIPGQGGNLKNINMKIL